MNEVETIISRHLSAGRAVALPGYGTIAVVRTRAQITDRGQRMAAPRCTIEVSSAEAHTVADYLSHDLGYDAAQAEEIFEGWLGAVSSGYEVNIAGVAVVNFDHFEAQIYPEFDALINIAVADRVVLRRPPQERKPLQPVRRSGGAWMWVAIVAVVAAAGYLAWYFFEAEIADFLIKLRIKN